MTPPITLHLVRHGETDWNLESRLQGWTDIPLNARGLEQAHAAAAALAHRPVGRVFSSDLLRARQTAKSIAARVGLQVVLEPALRERCYGTAEGRTDTELEQEFGRQLDDRWIDPDFSFTGGESRRAVHTRLREFLVGLLESPPPGELVLVSHGGSLRAARGFLEGIPVERLPGWEFHNGEITTLTVRLQAVSDRPTVNADPT